MSKWDKILGGDLSSKTLQKELKSVDLSQSNHITFISVSMLILFVAVAVFFVFKAKEGLNTSVIQEVGTVVSKKVEVSNEIVAEIKNVVEVTPEIPAPTVKAKNSGKMFFEKAEMDDETFDHFEKVFDESRFDPVQDKIKYKGQNEALHDFLSKTGQSADDFMNNSDSFVPESLFEEKHIIVDKHVFNEDESIIVKEAVQFAPIKCSANEAALIWTEVLEALKEASVSNIQLPEMHEDQLKSLQYWSKTSGSAGKIANAILNRLN